MPGIESDGEELPRLSPGVGCDSTAQGDKVNSIKGKSLYTGFDKTSLYTSSGSLFVTHSLSPRHVERNYLPLFGVAQSNVDLRNYVISRQIVI